MSQESNFSVTVKTPKGNLVTVRGDTSAEWVANLGSAGTSGALGMIASIEASLAGQVPANPVIPTVDARRPAPAGPEQPAQELPAGFGVKCDTCQAPAEFVKAGVSSQSGKPYKRYRCTANALHKATFTN